VLWDVVIFKNIKINFMPKYPFWYVLGPELAISVYTNMPMGLSRASFSYVTKIIRHEI